MTDPGSPAAEEDGSFSASKVLVGGILAAGFCILVLLMMSAQMRSFMQFRVMPSSARNGHFSRLVHQDLGDVYLVGTTHLRHYSSSSYGLRHLDALLQNAGADVVFVEARQEEVARGFYGDGPVEMPYIALRAKELQLQVRGYDWWVEKTSEAKATGKTREQHMLDRLLAGLRETSPTHRKALVFIGYASFDRLRSRLQEQGFETGALDDDTKDKWFTPTAAEDAFRFPAGMADAVQRRVSLLEERQKTAIDLKWKKDLERVIQRRKELLKHVQGVGERAAPTTPPTPAPPQGTPDEAAP